MGETLTLPTGAHCAVGPDRCTGCKLRYWRLNGSPFSLPTHFKAATSGGYTQRELENEIITEAARTGREIERKK